MHMKRMIYIFASIVLFVDFLSGQRDPTTDELVKPSSQLSVRIVDENGKLTSARVWVDVGGRRIFQSITPESVTSYARDKSFSCDGIFSLDLSAGNAIVHLEKGKEYRPLELSIAIGPDEKVSKTIQLQRWVDMPAEDWYSADLHVHLGQDNPRILRQLALADDVHVVPAFTYWLKGRGEIWNAQWPDSSYTKPIEIDDRHLITRNNIEIERINREAIPGGSIGATFLYNLNLPVTAEQYGEHFPSDAALSLSAQLHSVGVVLDSDKPSWAETVIGVALGAMNTIQVCHNHYHRNATLPGGWGMIGPLDIGDSNDAVADGLFHRTNNLYYRFLNCGFRLGVSGGSAIGVMPVATGQHRVYAKIDGEFTAGNFWEALKAGRSFATSGPMLDLTADGESVGETILRTGEDKNSINIRALVRAIESLEALQVIHNGRILASFDLLDKDPGSMLFEELSIDLMPQRSGWIAGRALYRAPDGLLRQAHTSPIYIELDNQPIAFSEDARYMLRWINEIERIAQSNPDRFTATGAQEAVLNDYGKARAVYLKIIQDAEQYWGE